MVAEEEEEYFSLLGSSSNSRASIFSQYLIIQMIYNKPGA